MILLEAHPISAGGTRQNKTRRKCNALSKSGALESRACVRNLSVYVFPLDEDDNGGPYPRVTRLLARV